MNHYQTTRDMKQFLFFICIAASTFATAQTNNHYIGTGSHSGSTHAYSVGVITLDGEIPGGFLGQLTENSVLANILENQPELANTIKAYPNPSDGKIFLTETELDLHHVEAKVFDTQGQLMMSTTIKGNSIDLSSLPNNPYFIYITNHSLIKVIKTSNH